MKDSKIQHITILTLLLFLTFGGAEAATHLYVSPSGHDMNDGSKKRPLLTPVEALLKARQQSRRDTLYIHLADGTYQLDETLRLGAEDSGTEKSPTVIVADHPGKAILSGGRRLEMSERMKGLNWWVGRPTVAHRNLEVRQLWRGEEKVPHASLVPMDSIIELSGSWRDARELWVSTESFDPVLDLIYGSRLGLAEDERIMKEVKAEEMQSLEMLASTENSFAVLRVKNFYIDGQNVRLTFHEPESRLLFSQPELPMYFNMTGGYSLVYPGTWYQNPKDGTIVYDPDEDERGANAHLAKAPFIMPVLEQLVQVSGEYDRPVEHIIFRGIRFEYTAWNRVGATGVVTTKGGQYLLNGGHEERQEAAVVVRNAHHVDFADCEFIHIGATAIDYQPGCEHGNVTGCRFEDIGGSAIATPVDPAMKGFRIQRNTFENIANEIWYSDAIRSK